MTDAELDALETAAKAAMKHGNCPSNAFQNAMIDYLTVEPTTILELIAELRQAKKERDWWITTATKAVSEIPKVKLLNELYFKSGEATCQKN